MRLAPSCFAKAGVTRQRASQTRTHCLCCSRRGLGSSRVCHPAGRETQAQGRPAGPQRGRGAGDRAPLAAASTLAKTCVSKALSPRLCCICRRLGSRACPASGHEAQAQGRPAGPQRGRGASGGAAQAAAQEAAHAFCSKDASAAGKACSQAHAQVPGKLHTLLRCGDMLQGNVCVHSLQIEPRKRACVRAKTPAQPAAKPTARPTRKCQVSVRFVQKRACMCACGHVHSSPSTRA